MEIDRQLHLRETAVRSAELKLVKMTLDQCALTEGVNALENCDGLVRQYLRMMKTHKVGSVRPSVRRRGRLACVAGFLSTPPLSPRLPFLLVIETSTLCLVCSQQRGERVAKGPRLASRGEWPRAHRLQSTCR